MIIYLINKEKYLTHQDKINWHEREAVTARVLTVEGAINVKCFLKIPVIGLHKRNDFLIFVQVKTKKKQICILLN